jgi:hypothetical protein
MPQFAVQLTIESVIREKKREERADARQARDHRRQLKAATAGTPLLQFDATETSDQEVRRG